MDTSNVPDTITPPHSPSVTSLTVTPTKPSTTSLHSSLTGIPTPASSSSYVANKSSSWSNLPLPASGSPRVDGIRIGNNPGNHEAIRNLAAVPGYQAFTAALPNTTRANVSSPLRITLDPEPSPNGISTTSSNHGLSHSAGSLVTANHISPGHASGSHGSGTWSNGGSGNYSGILSSSGSGSGNFNGFMNTLEDIDATPMLLTQGIVKALKGIHTTLK